MKKLSILWLVIFLMMPACNLLANTPAPIPTLPFPTLAPTVTPLPIVLPDTPTPQILTATPITPSPTPAHVSLKKRARWTHPMAYEALWNLKFGRFVIVGQQQLTSYLVAEVKKDWSVTPETSQGVFQAASLSSNGNFIVTFDLGPAVHLYDTKTGELLEKKRVLSECGNTSLRQSVYLSNGMKELFTAAQDHPLTAPIEIRKWGIAPYRCDWIASIQSGAFNTLLLSPDERFLVLVSAVGKTGQVMVWNTSDGRSLCTIPGTAAAFHRDGRLAVADMQRGSLVYWKMEGCRILSELPWASYDGPQTMTFTPNGKYLLTFRQGIQIWDPTTAGLLWERSIPEADSGGLLRVSPDGKYLLSITNPGTWNAQIDFWSIETK
ncbi:MAG: hypothetical protein DDG60_02730 [Anaerolineae bacterium]|nr:MAG: hypothetical protein DDG60_02730 [Anaerolineae bacterium]